MRQEIKEIYLCLLHDRVIKVSTAIFNMEFDIAIAHGNLPYLEEAVKLLHRYKKDEKSSI